MIYECIVKRFRYFLLDRNQQSLCKTKSKQIGTKCSFFLGIFFVFDLLRGYVIGDWYVWKQAGMDLPSASGID